MRPAGIFGGEMREVVAVEYVTVDGVMEDPGWSNEYFNDELAKYQYDRLFASDALLLGRVTFEGFAAAWPSMEETEGDFAVRMNALPKFVASRTLSEPLAWNGTLLKGDLVEEVAKLKQAGKDLLIYGSAELVNALHPHGLIDEYRLMVFPVTLGGGKRLFSEGTDKTDLKLSDVKTTSTGVALLTYRTARP
jgi:dihydrofolate reductase